MAFVRNRMKQPLTFGAFPGTRAAPAAVRVRCGPSAGGADSRPDSQHVQLPGAEDSPSRYQVGCRRPGTIPKRRRPRGQCAIIDCANMAQSLAQSLAAAGPSRFLRSHRVASPKTCACTHQPEALMGACAVRCPKSVDTEGLVKHSKRVDEVCCLLTGVQVSGWRRDGARRGSLLPAVTGLQPGRAGRAGRPEPCHHHRAGVCFSSGTCTVRMAAVHMCQRRHLQMSVLQCCTCAGVRSMKLAMRLSSRAND